MFDNCLNLAARTCLRLQYWKILHLWILLYQLRILNILLILCVGDKFCGKKNQIAKYVCTYKVFPGQPLVYAVFWIFLYVEFLFSPSSEPHGDQLGFCPLRRPTLGHRVLQRPLSARRSSGRCSIISSMALNWRLK